MNDAPSGWRKCTSCKKPIGFGQKYWTCSVSTCNRLRTELIFCSVSCFDAHVPVMNHRDAGAIEHRAPSEREWQKSQEEPASPPTERAPSSPSQPGVPREKSASSAEEVLVVVSKVKEYIRSVSGMNTSDAVMRILSDRVRRYAEDGIRSARQNNRKTVLDRDVR